MDKYEDTRQNIPKAIIEDYIFQRNSCIPEAQRFADAKCGRLFVPGRYPNRTSWDIAWSKAFLDKMHRLVKGMGLPSYR